MSRTQNSLKNAKYDSIAYATKVLAAFFLRMVFVAVLRNEYTGVEGVFSTLLYFIALVELGYETAVSYALYGPIAGNDYARIRTIMAAYRKISRRIGLAILFLGAACLPFLHVLILDMPDIPHISLFYLLYVADTAAGYFFYYNKVLITADQKQYIVAGTHYFLGTVMNLVQAALLIWTRDFFAYICAQLAFTLLENALLACRVRRLYPWLKEKTPGTEKKAALPSVRRHVRFVLFHKASMTVLTYADTVLVSGFVGLLAAGIYSNYKFITYALHSAYNLLLNSVAAGVGNLGAVGRRERNRQVFSAFHLVGAWVYGFSFICLYILFDPFIKIWLGADSLLSQGAVAAIALQFYLQGMIKPLLIYRDALGLFAHDWYVPVTEAGLYILLGALLVGPLGIAGIFWGGVLAHLLTSFWAEPRTVFQKGFLESPRRYFEKTALYMAVTAGAGALTALLCRFMPGEGAVGFLYKLGVCLICPNLLFFAAYRKTPECRMLRQAVERMRRKGKPGPEQGCF